MNPVVSVVVFILVALLLLCIILLAVSLRKTRLRSEDLPACEGVEVMEPKLRAMLQDLVSLSEKMSLNVFPQVSLGSVLRPKPSVENAEGWAGMIAGESVDFALCDPDKARARLVVMHGDGLSERRKERLAFIERACESAQIPVLVVRDYNLPGLEKALQQKLAPPRKGRAARGEPQTQDAAAT